jgi:UDP-glucose 4-epimerase
LSIGASGLASRNVLVTGGLGFIGSNLAERCVREGARVTLVDSLIPEYGGDLYNVREIAGAVRINISDIRDERSLRYLVRDQEFLFNLAGQTSHLDSMRDPFTDLDINCRAQLSVLEACRHHAPRVRVVFASTRQVYGRPDRVPVAETHPVRPVDVNGIHKLAAESYHLLYDTVYDLWTCALRLTNTYGPRMRVRDARQTFLGVWIRSLVQGVPFEVWDGEQRRDLLYVDDAVEALVRAASSDRARGQIFNVGGPGSVSLRELAEILVRLSGGGTYVTRPFPPERKRIDIGDFVADSGKIADVLGWRPVVGLDEGLRRTLAYYREHGEHYWDAS